jgi:asparagine synthetase B (glutamine-hydrolysing)
MCGIAGFLLRGAEAQVATVAEMCGKIRHRGPDDEGFRVEGPCALGMRRLSIIDLSSGHQDEHQSGRRDNSDCLWALLMPELWFAKLESRS